MTIRHARWAPRFHACTWFAILSALVFCGTSGAEPARALFLDRGRPNVEGDLLLLTQRIAVFEIARTAHVDTLNLAGLYLVQTSRHGTDWSTAVVASVVGAAIGGLAGLVGALAASSGCDDPNEAECFDGLTGVAWGVPIGAGIGLLVGLIPRTTWTTVYASPDAQHEQRERSGWNN